MQHVVAAGDGFGPAGVFLEIGGDEAQAIAGISTGFLEGGAHAAFAIHTPYGRAHLMARGQELEDRVAADEARAAGDQDFAHVERVITPTTASGTSYFFLGGASSVFLKTLVKPDSSDFQGMSILKYKTRSG